MVTKVVPRKIGVGAVAIGCGAMIWFTVVIHSTIRDEAEGSRRLDQHQFSWQMKSIWRERRNGPALSPASRFPVAVADSIATACVAVAWSNRDTEVVEVSLDEARGAGVGSPWMIVGIDYRARLMMRVIASESGRPIVAVLDEDLPWDERERDRIRGRAVQKIAVDLWPQQVR